MRTRLLAAALTLIPAGQTLAQPGTGETWDTFGPDRASGVFLNITREHLENNYADAIAVDHADRILILNDWREDGSTNLDCALTRHIANARLLDMSFTGPQELEATQRIALDLGGANLDVCNSLAVDDVNRPIIAGFATTGSVTSGFLMRRRTTGIADTSFSSDGQLALANVAGFTGTDSRLDHVLSIGEKIVACGSVKRGASFNMLIVRFSANGQLDTSFSGNGWAEVDFGVNGTRNDSCKRIVALPNGDLIAGGTITDANGARAYGFARFNSSGGFVTSFGNQGRLIIENTSQIASTPSLTDLAWDAGRNRLLAACNLSFAFSLADTSCVMAIRGANGALDPTFSNAGRLSFRFSNFGGGIRETGDSTLTRIHVRDDGSFYALGTHENSETDASTYGSSDFVSMRFEADGSVVESGPQAYAGDGITFTSMPEVSVSQVAHPNSSWRRVGETLVDSTIYRGNLLFLVNRNRFPSFVYDHDGDGNLDEPGPIAPVAGALVTDGLFSADFDYDGVAPSTLATPITQPPAGLGNYCSVRAANGAFGLLPQGSGSDPCQVFLNDNPSLIIERAGKYSLSGFNWVIGTCSGGFITLRSGNGTAPFDLAFNDAAGRSNCVFTASPDAMPVFSRPYTGTNSGVGNTQSFNHDPYNISLDVTDFGQSSTNGFNACAIDNRGRQRSIGNPDANPSTCNYDNSGVDEPAMDIGVTNSRNVIAVADGRVTMAIPRHVPRFSPASMDPYQREVFVRHSVGGGRYAEEFTTYYAHMSDTAVRTGDLVLAGDVLGQVGTTGASGGEHLHLGVIRHTNLTFRPTFELNFVGGSWDRDASVGAVDPFGWLAPQGFDPWAWRFRNHASNPLLNDAGALSPQLWRNGQAPPLQ